MIFVLAGALLAAVQTSASAEATRRASVLEAVVRHVAAQHCKDSLCYVSIEGRAPRAPFAGRLTDIPHVKAIPEGGVPAAERGDVEVIDLDYIRIKSGDNAQVTAAVCFDVEGTLLATESCTYQLRRTSDGWEVKPKETRCLVL